jgi:predicted kinase
MLLLQSLQELCRAHRENLDTAKQTFHYLKRETMTTKEKDTPFLIVVAGPPAAGKSTYVETNRDFRDVVIDLDRLQEAFGSRGTHGHHKNFLEFAEVAAEAAIQKAREKCQTGRVWIIKSGATIEDRYSLPAQAVIMIETPAAECTIRANNAGRPAEWRTLIREWWKNYEPATTDILLNPYENLKREHNG